MYAGADIIYDASADVYRYSQPFDPEGHPITDEDSDNPASYSDYHRGYAIARGRIFTRVRESEGEGVGTHTQQVKVFIHYLLYVHYVYYIYVSLTIH